MNNSGRKTATYILIDDRLRKEKNKKLNPDLRILSLAIISIVSLFTTGTSCMHRDDPLWQKNELDSPQPFAKLLLSSSPVPLVSNPSQLATDSPPEEQIASLSESRNPDYVSSIVIHNTGNRLPAQYLQKSIQSGWMVHFIISKNGDVYGPVSPGNIRYPATPHMDDTSIHISLEGSISEIVKNNSQFESLQNLTERIVRHYNIPLNNYDIDSRKGIFSHDHTKKRFGGFIELQRCKTDPIVKELLKRLGGKYYDEKEWANRYEFGWIYVLENPESLKKREEIDSGPGFTEAPVAQLKSVESDSEGKLPDERRLNYPDRGPIEVSCAVLHFTATSTMSEAIDILSTRRLSSQLMVDTDGRAYQIMDRLESKAAAASDTNDHCVQVEIVGKGMSSLMRYKQQQKKVVEIVKELSKKYSFPLNNHDVASFRGVFSHTQAKKKWGRSVYLTGKDYDPGEPYMKLILEMAGGIYYPEAEWAERQSENWAIMDREFQP